MSVERDLMPVVLAEEEQKPSVSSLFPSPLVPRPILAFRHARGINGTTLSCQTTESIIDLCSRLGFTIDKSKVDEDIADGSCTAGELAEEFEEFKRMEAEEEENPEYGAVPNARICLAKWLGMDDEEDKQALDAVEHSMNLLIVLRKMQRIYSCKFTSEPNTRFRVKALARLGQETLLSCPDGKPSLGEEYPESHLSCRRIANLVLLKQDGKPPTPWECHWWARILCMSWAEVFGAFVLGVIPIGYHLEFLQKMPDRTQLLKKYGRFGKALGRINYGYISETEIRGEELAGVQVIAKTLVGDNGRKKLEQELAVLDSLPACPGIVEVHDRYQVEPYFEDPGVTSSMPLVNDANSYTGFVMPKYNRTWRPDCWKEVLRWTMSVGDALAVVHEAGWIHRDVKPDNILAKTDPVAGIMNPVLIDFGAAVRFATPAGGSTSVYVAPEKWFKAEIPGVEFELLDFAAQPAMDVWSLGMTMLTWLRGGSVIVPADEELSVIEDRVVSFASTMLGLIARWDDGSLGEDAVWAELGVEDNGMKGDGKVIDVLLGMLHPDPRQRWSLVQIKTLFS